LTRCAYPFPTQPTQSTFFLGGLDEGTLPRDTLIHFANVAISLRKMLEFSVAYDGRG
jgi:hypothetical protein